MSSPPPALPNEDYEAIEAAVMDTARGRWFLAEFARRNRSADTTLLLAAIERLEKLMAATGSAEAKPHTPVVTSVATSASAELFAIEKPLSATAHPSGPRDTGETAWIIEDSASPKPVGAHDVVEIDDAERLWKPFETETGDTAEPDLEASPESSTADLAAAPSERPSQGAVLSTALAAAQETIARTAETPPPPPEGHTPAPVDPATLDALSFDEKIVYFA